MKRAGEAAWIRATLACYRAGLYLYPKQVRERHGEDMLQVLRDRCREADLAGRSRLRMLATEILPDAMRSAGASHWSLGIGEASARHVLQLVLLLLLAVVLLFRDPVDRWVLDRASAATQAWQQWSDARALAHDEAQLRDFAQGLATGGVRDRVLSAYLHRMLAEGRAFHQVEEGPVPLLVADGARGVALLRTLPPTRDAFALALAVQACGTSTGCDRGELVRRLVAADASNGYAWSLAFREAAARRDDAAMARTLAAMARSTHYDDYLARTRRELVAAALKTDAQGEDLLPVLARRMQEARFLDFTEFRNEARMACTPASVPWNSGAKRWIDTHPQSQGDCLRVAQLYAHSGSLWPAQWGARLVEHLQPSAQASARLAQVQLLWQRSAMVGTAKGADGLWHEATEAEWADWARTWLQEGSEREIVARSRPD